MADAAKERNITIQYCLPSATDMLVSLLHPAVVQVRTIVAGTPECHIVMCVIE